MSRLIVLTAVVLVVAVLVGCNSTRTGVREAHERVAVPSTAASDSPRPDHADRILTALPPIAAIDVVTDLYGNFQFEGVTLGGHRSSPPQPERVDQFSGRARAVSADGEMMLAVCRWVREGQSEILFQSDLPADRHAYVVKELRKELEARTPAPAAER